MGLEGLFSLDRTVKRSIQPFEPLVVHILVLLVSPSVHKSLGLGNLPFLYVVLLCYF